MSACANKILWLKCLPKMNLRAEFREKSYVNLMNTTAFAGVCTHPSKVEPHVALPPSCPIHCMVASSSGITVCWKKGEVSLYTSKYLHCKAQDLLYYIYITPFMFLELRKWVFLLSFLATRCWTNKHILVWQSFPRQICLTAKIYLGCSFVWVRNRDLGQN